MIRLVAAVTLAAIWGALAQDGPAVIAGYPEVVDGDSLKIDHSRIRLAGIDAPESAQRCTDAFGQPYDCGLMATSVLEEEISGRSVRCEVTGMDKYSRYLAVCRVGSVELNDYMVRSGWAIDYARYDLTHRYSQAQQEAISNKRGIWQGHFEPPEWWRREHQQ